MDQVRSEVSRRSIAKAVAWTTPVVMIGAAAPVAAASCAQLPSLAMPDSWGGPAIVGGIEATNGTYTDGYKTYTSTPIRSDGVTRYWSWQDDSATSAGDTTKTLTRQIAGLEVGQQYRIDYSTQMGAGAQSTGGVRRSQWVDVTIGSEADRFGTNAPASPPPAGYEVLVATRPGYPIYTRSVTFTASATSMTLTVRFTLPGVSIDGDANDDIGVGGFSIACT